MNDHAGPHWNEPSPLPDRKPPLPESALTPNEYQRRASLTAVYSDGCVRAIESDCDTEGDPPYDLLARYELNYLTLGLISEVGELCALAKRELRGDFPNRSSRIGEFGGILWYFSELANRYGFTLDEIMQYNLNQLADRAERGTIKGKGDER